MYQKTIQTRPLTKMTSFIGSSLVAQLVKNPPAMQETPVQFLGQKVPLEKGALEREMSIHSSVLAWRIPGTGKPWWAAVCGVTQS